MVDYMGFRFVAMATLPIHRRTLSYGSADGGQTFAEPERTTLPFKLDSLFDKLTSKLKIGYHYIQNHPNRIWGPGDIEIHYGLDGRYYVLDLARLSPPMDFHQFASPSATRGRQLTDLFRFEFLISNSKSSLSSDGFTRFASSRDKEQQEEEISKVTSNFLRKFLPKRVDIWSTQSLNTKWIEDHAEISVLGFLHNHGINGKFLGICWELSKSSTLRKYFFHELIARVFKDQIKKFLRDLHLNSQKNFEAILQILNSILGNKIDKEELILLFKLKYPFMHADNIEITLEDMAGIQALSILPQLLQKVGLNCKRKFQENFVLTMDDFDSPQVVFKFRYQFVENSSIYTQMETIPMGIKNQPPDNKKVKEEQEISSLSNENPSPYFNNSVEKPLSVPSPKHSPKSSDGEDEYTNENVFTSPTYALQSAHPKWERHQKVMMMNSFPLRKKQEEEIKDEKLEKNEEEKKLPVVQPVMKNEISLSISPEVEKKSHCFC
jgi:hypothetical protein